MNLGNVDEMVQRVDGVLVIDAKAIYDSMCGASGPRTMEEKRTAIEMMGIQEGMKVRMRYYGGVTEKQISAMDLAEKRQKRSRNVSMAMNVCGVLYMTKK